jgi:hypothetical protein
MSTGTVTNSYYTAPAITGKDNDGNALDNANCAVGYNYNGTIGTDVFLAPKDDKDNTGFLDLMAARNAALTAVERTTPLSTDVDITLQGRTLTKDGKWNTLCLPFSLTAQQIAASPLAGATIKELDNTADGTSLDNGTLTLKFNTASGIEAGKPYVIKWESGDNIVDPVFTDVTITSTTPTSITSNDGRVTFVGQYSPFTIDNSNIDEIILLSTDNRLGYSKNARTLRPFRCHFYVPTTDDAPAARDFILDFDGDGSDIVSAIVSINDDDSSQPSPYGLSRTSSHWYSLDGRQLGTKPTQKGIYVFGGRKVVIK